MDKVGKGRQGSAGAWLAGGVAKAMCNAGHGGHVEARAAMQDGRQLAIGASLQRL